MNAKEKTDEIREWTARHIAVLRGLILWELLSVKQTKESGEACLRQAEENLRFLKHRVRFPNGEELEVE